MAFNKYKVPTFQMVIQIGMFPRISRYFVSAVQYFTREAAVTAGEQWLRKEGLDVSRTYIHTRHVWRGDKDTIKDPVAPTRKELSEVEFWIHDKKLRKLLGIKAAF